MDAAQQAINKLFNSGSSMSADETAAPAPAVEDQVSPDSAVEHKAVTKEEEVVPAVEHETIKREHETREEAVIDKERHQHHYHTTVQPLEDREVLPTQHDQEQAAPEVYEYDHGDGGDTKGQVDARNAGFQSTSEEGQTYETTTKQETVAGEQVHHHLHETIQPVIEKETVQPSVTHKTIPVKEIHHDESKDHGTTIKPPMSADAFQGRLDGEERTEYMS